MYKSDLIILFILKLMFFFNGNIIYNIACWKFVIKINIGEKIMKKIETETAAEK